MRVNGNYNLKNVVSTDEFRPAMHRVLLNGDKAVASNMYILTIVPIVREEGDTDKDILIHIDVWQRIVALKHTIGKMDRCELTDEHTKIIYHTGLEIIFPHPSQEDKFPPYQKIFTDQLDDLKANEEQYDDINLNINYLFDIAKAMNCSTDRMGVTMLIHKTNKHKPLYLLSQNDDEKKIGLIMPTTVGNAKDALIAQIEEMLTLQTNGNAEAKPNRKQEKEDKNK